MLSDGWLNQYLDDNPLIQEWLCCMNQAAKAPIGGSRKAELEQTPYTEENPND
mgnify:CR=1 FL=1